MSILDKITPGKWEVIYEINIQAKEKGRFIASCGYNSNKPDNHEENKANAKLCAACPEMLSIIERLGTVDNNEDDAELAAILLAMRKEAAELLNKLNSKQ